LVTAGVFLVIRLHHNLDISSFGVSLLCTTGRITCLLGGLAAIVENDLKKLVALSTLSQLGVIIFCLGLGITYYSLFHLFTHAFFKATLFIVSGLLIIKGFGNQDIRLLGSILVQDRLLRVFFFIALFSIIGLPFLRAYISKHTIIDFIFSAKINFFILCLIYIGSLLTVIYNVRILIIILFPKSSLTSNISSQIFFRSYLPL
jgi:NADH-ubiquinone oxidoreductase chain 5